jgi:hypothetical protein
VEQYAMFTIAAKKGFQEIKTSEGSCGSHLYAGLVALKVAFALGFNHG